MINFTLCFHGQWEVFFQILLVSSWDEIQVQTEIFSSPDGILTRLHVNVLKMKSHLGMKKFLFTREFHPGMKFNLKENFLLSMMKTYNKISHFSQLLISEAQYVKNIRRLKARCIKWLRLNA